MTASGVPPSTTASRLASRYSKRSRFNDSIESAAVAVQSVMIRSVGSSASIRAPRRPSGAHLIE
jgi:hypothetical protein